MVNKSKASSEKTPKETRLSPFYDVIIIGGGLAGLTQAILLAKQGIETLCIDKDQPVTQLDRSFDTRTTAISWGSRNILRAAGIWPSLEENACAIKDIRILDGESPFVLKFLSEEVEDREFGWIVDNYDLRLALHEKAARQNGLTHQTGDAVTSIKNQTAETPSDDKYATIQTDSGVSIKAQLILGCDGRNSMLREWMGIGTWGHDYDQTAIVAIVAHEKPHENAAIEHFLPEGPFASLPMSGNDDTPHRSAIVWTVHGKEAKTWLHCSESTFNTRLNGLYKGSFGHAALCSKRAGWPLSVKIAYHYVDPKNSPRMALLAEAAHGIHPIAGQGLNISLRDVAAMTEILSDAKKSDIDLGSASLLRQYQSKRRLDNTAMSLAMEGFNTLFSNNIAPLRAARRIGLRAVNRLAKAKRFFMTQAMGTVGHVPELIKNQDPSVTQTSLEIEIEADKKRQY